MQQPPIPIPEEIIDKFENIERLLDVTYGPRVLRASRDPISELIGTILSQNTSDTNTSRSMATLRERFPTWQHVRDAATVDIVDAIRSGGLANRKAPRIQAVLEEVVARQGDTDLTFLAGMPLEEAKAWLTSMNGIGPKTAACVLLFSLGRPAMPVDTHVGRVMARLGVVPDRTSTITKERILETLIGPDPDTVYAIHVETIEHGRRICRAQRPKCPECPLREYCDYYNEHCLA
ncbi:MAG TPA: endonuclease III [Thermomicrobiales bacterium]|nr:endonuclease III [Thermomicrobiales bacterium]